MVAVVVVGSESMRRDGKRNNNNKHFVECLFSQDTRILQGVLENRFLDGGEDESDVRGIGSLGETVARRLAWTHDAKELLHTEDRG